MREQHQLSGPGKPQNWKETDSGNWVCIGGPEDEEDKKRKADGNFSPVDKDKGGAKKGHQSPVNPAKQNQQ